METLLAHACAADEPLVEGPYGLRAPQQTPGEPTSPDRASGDLGSRAFRKLGLVHDLRNLLQVISSALQLIDREADRAGTAIDVHRLTQSALSSIDRAADLSRQILDTSSPTSAPADAVDLTAALVAMRDSISLVAGRSVAIEILTGDDVPQVRCDRREFENVLLNLVANARDAMPTGGQLTISLNGFSGGATGAVMGRSMAVLRVEDTGSGMSDATKHRALTPFFSTKPKDRGTGLGLAIVNDFALRAGGSVEIESILGMGTSIVVRLPSNDIYA